MGQDMKLGCLPTSTVRMHTLHNPIQETTLSVQFVPGMRFLVFDFAVYRMERERERERSASVGETTQGVR
eukprot:2309454-Rhodomonas_salina.2